jgi:hypothetical protein
MVVMSLSSPHEALRRTTRSKLKRERAPGLVCMDELRSVLEESVCSLACEHSRAQCAAERPTQDARSDDANNGERPANR